MPLPGPAGRPACYTSILAVASSLSRPGTGRTPASHAALPEAHSRDRGIPFGICPVIYLEVLQGAATKQDFDLLKEYLGSLPLCDLRDARESAARAAAISFELRRKGVAVKSTIDFLIAQTAIDNDLYLLHNDADFDRMARVAPLKIWA